MKKLFLLRDNLFATVFVFVCIIIFSFSFIHIGPLNPLGKAIADFDFADLVFKHRAEEPMSNKDIVLVNIAGSRAEIAKQIEVLNKFKPKVIAIDAIFASKGDSAADQALAKSLSEVDNLVMGSRLESDSGDEINSVIESDEFFSRYGRKGYMNFVGEEQKTIRWCLPQAKYTATGKEIVEQSLASAVLAAYDSNAFQKISEKHESEFINYRYSSESFTRFDVGDLTEDNSDLSVIKDKIVILGQLGENLQNSTLEDLHFTPFNPELSARSNPDHYGAYIHANIIAMALADDYVKSVPDWLVWLISVVVCYLHMVFFINYYVEKHIWFHLAAKFIQLLTSALIIGLALYLLNTHNLKINTGYILAPVILSVDLLYFYDGLVKWLHKKYGYRTYFMSHEHH